MTGGIVAIVPVRSLTSGKTRLAGRLTAEARQAITRRMVQRVIGAALETGAVTRVIVVSEDRAALDFASAIDPRVTPLLQTPAHPGLLGALDQARELALHEGAAGLLILFGDLPLIDGDDVRDFVRRSAAVIIAPDRHGAGTNALLLRPNATPPDEPGFQFQFGEGSYARHVAEAHRLGLDVATSMSGGLSFDLDTPDDLAALIAEAGDTAAALVGDAIHE